MKISILLPYKENFSPNYAGAVSLFINDTLKISKYKNKNKVPVLAGGVFPTFAPEICIKYNLIDMICVGEGENALIDI